MNKENTYLFLIYFTIILFVKLIIDLIVEMHFPTYENLDNSTPFWKNLAKIKDIFNSGLIIVILYLLIFVKLNILIIFLLLICLSTAIEYFLITRRYIFLFIEENSTSYKIVKNIDMYFDKIQNICLLIFVSYLLIRIFGHRNI